MKYLITQDVFTGRFDALLLGGEFPNTHGTGDTPEGAVMSLKLLLNIKRKTS